MTDSAIARDVDAAEPHLGLGLVHFRQGRVNDGLLEMLTATLLVFGRFDFLFSTLDSSGLARECRTVDDWFRSDHRPVVLTVHRP